MYTIVGSSGSWGLTADAPLTGDDFDAIALRLAAHGLVAFCARKIGYVCARQITAQSALNDNHAAQGASPGDWLVTNMSQDRRVIRKNDGRPDTYIIHKDRFADLYQRDTGATEYGDIYKPTSMVDAVELAAGLDMVASWGGRQLFKAGYLLRNGQEVYGADTQTFSSTYEFECDAAPRA